MNSHDYPYYSGTHQVSLQPMWGIRAKIDHQTDVFQECTLWLFHIAMENPPIFNR